MRHAVLALAAIVLAGCDHYVDLTPGSFVQGNAGRDRFLHDNLHCQGDADARRQVSGNGDPHGIYNDIYSQCMRQLGYSLEAPEGFAGL